jgi:hypothetical protein
MDMIWFFLPAILLLGGITSYEDYRISKIRNKWIILSLLYSIVVNLALILYFSSTTGIRTHYIIELATNFVFALLVGFSLWYYNIWTAGDGKLFIAYAVLIPFSVYKWGYQQWIPSQVLLINIFIIGFFSMAFIIFLKSKLKKIGQLFIRMGNSLFNLQRWALAVMFLFAILWLIGLLFRLAGMDISVFLMFLIALIMGPLLRYRWFIFSMIFTGILRLFFDPDIYTLSFLAFFIFLLFIWMIATYLLSDGIFFIGESLFTELVSTDKLKPGMVLYERIVKDRKGDDVFYRKEKKQPFEVSKGIFSEESEGVSPDQIKKIHSTGIKDIRVSKTIPFAPFLFLGVILTLLLSGSLLVVLKNMI